MYWNFGRTVLELYDQPNPPETEVKTEEKVEEDKEGPYILLSKV